MKITFLAPVADMSGGARVNTIYARELAKRGHDVQVVIARPRPPSLRNRLRHMVRGYGLRGRQEPSHFDSIEPLVKRMKRSGPVKASDVRDADVIVATWWETAEWMAAMPATKGRHVHLVQGYEAFEQMPKDRVDAVLRTVNRKITISGWLCDLLVSTFGNEDVYLVPNGVDIGQFNAEPRDRSAVPTVGMLYNTAPFKNMAGAIAAFKGLKEHRPDAQLIAFGTGDVRNDNPLPDGAIYHRLPAQETLKTIYGTCDVWLCSSTSEGFGLPALEAMACRCPVISTPVGGPLDFVVDGRNGFIVPFNDVSAMTGKLIELFEMDGAAWREMSDQAFGTAQMYNWDHSVNKFEQALKF